MRVLPFKSTQTNAKMYIYVPAQNFEKAPIIFAIHYCNGNAQAYFTSNSSKYATLADTKEYIVIYPSSSASGGCWGVASMASLTHDSGRDSQTIVNMMKYAVKNYGGDQPHYKYLPSHVLSSLLLWLNNFRGLWRKMRGCAVSLVYLSEGNYLINFNDSIASFALHAPQYSLKMPLRKNR